MHAVKGAGRLIAGRYQLLGPIGRGAMGIVWRGRDELLHRDVAVKEVQISALTMPADAEASYQRTLREARTAARLSHPSVITVFDVVEEGGSPWIVMELVGGRSLDQVIAEDGPLPPQHAAELGTSLLGALAAAHAAGVLHRDVKPGNVLIAADGRAVLTDFGIATFEEDPALTQAGMVVGTPGFTAPERVHGHGATPASDLWSLGATLYAAVEGRGPFDRPGGPAAVSAGVAREDAPRSPSAGPLGPVIDALLRRDPAARPDAASAATLLTEASVAAGTGPAPLTGTGWAAGEPPGGAGADDATAALPARPGGGPPGRAPSFLDPPVFADLQMPGGAGGVGGGRRRDLADAGRDGASPAGTVQNGAAPYSGAPYSGAPYSGAQHARYGTGLPEFLDPPGSRPPARPGGPGQFPPGAGEQRGPEGEGRAPQPGWPSPANRRGPGPRYWRMATVSAGIAAIIVAALLGFNIYSRTLAAGSPGAQGGDQAAGTAGRSGSSSGSTASGSAASGSTASGSTEARGGVTAGAGSSAGTGITSAPAPAGYRWHTVRAARLGTTAGFAIAAPDAWPLRTQGQTAFLSSPAGAAQVEVDLSPFTYARPVAQARYQEVAALATHEYPGYRPVSIQPAEFAGAAAAAWRFSWKPAGAARTTVLVILVTLPTSAGRQPYALSVSAPSAYFAAARLVFDKSLSTFQPLPAG